MKAIVAMSENRAIGLKNTIPWRSKEDFKWFKEFTLNKTLLVGFNTYKTLPDLKGRKLIVLDRYRINDSFYNPLIDKVVYYSSDDVAISLDKHCFNGELIVIGGAKTYEKFLPYITEFYVTHVKGEFEGDVFMPEFESHFSNKEFIKKIDIGEIWKYSK